MAAAYTIRLARADDVAGLPAVEHASAQLFRTVGIEGGYLDQTRTHEELDAARRESRLWVAADAGDRAVGFALATVLGELPHLEELSVHPDHGRRGLGRRLVEAVIAWARARNAPALTLSTFRDVAWNAPFYARIGFAVVPVETLDAELLRLRGREREQGLPIERRVVMRLPLEGATE
jgi:GNAT superfamily N-acetyltransferase